MIPDRRGNNRVDTPVNIARGPRVTPLFLLPGIGQIPEGQRNGPDQRRSGPVSALHLPAREPRSILILDVTAVYFHCPRAAVRSELWNPARLLTREALPSSGTILGDLSRNEIDRAAWDNNREQVISETLYECCGHVSALGSPRDLEGHAGRSRTPALLTGCDHFQGPEIRQRCPSDAGAPTSSSPAGSRFRKGDGRPCRPAPWPQACNNPTAPWIPPASSPGTGTCRGSRGHPRALCRPSS